jgi:hypothetical protein
LISEELHPIVGIKHTMDIVLKSVVKRQIGSTITGVIVTYYYGFLFSIIVNSTIWWGVSYFVNKYYWKTKAVDDQKYLVQYALAKFGSSRNKKRNA